MNNIRAVIKALKSEKIKDRQEAIASLKNTFNDDRAVANFSKGPNGQTETRNWLILYQGLFQVVRTERELLKKARTRTTKGISETTVLRRLEDAAKTVRWFVEKTTELLSSKVLSAIYSHLTGMLAIERNLFAPVALDYLKALKHIANYRPHLDHMDDVMWIKCVEICFNVILGDSLRSSLDEDEGDASEAASNYASEGGDSDRSDDELPSTLNPRKRGPPKNKGRDFHLPKTPAKASVSKLTSRRQQISVTLEQVECASLLTILLCSPNSPITSPSHRYLPSAILTRLRRFLEMYPSESSLLHDYLISVSFTLEHLAFNTVQNVRSFAIGTWNGFVHLWGVKDRRLKEELLIVLRLLLPFIIAEEPVLINITLDPGFDIAEGLGELWAVLDGEAENRWGVNGLRIDSIRLELLEGENSSSSDVGDNPFVASTFRAGWNFDSSQALSWAILELQADCGKELFKLSENTHGTTPRSQAKGKRVKLQNPIAALVNSIHTQPTSHIRSYHLQVLLFFVDKHWGVIHDTLKHDIVNTLLQFVTLEDADIQPWIFLNLAGVAFADRRWVEENPDLLTTSQPIEVLNAKTWDTVWAHAVRRANVPGLCRAACHAAHTLLVSLFRYTPPSGHIFLTSQQVLLDIESIGKDLDVQGPSFPFDSVCMFLSKCLRIAAQDVRLYRMQLEDKVSKWLADAWTVTGATRDTVVLNTVGDTLLLLEMISGLSKQSDLSCRVALPISPIVESMKLEKRTQVIRDYLLFARLPSCDLPQVSDPSSLLHSQDVAPLPSLAPSSDDIRLEPRPRERKISSFLQRMLDALTVEWEARTSNAGHPSIEVARQALDFTITAIAFECTLTINSTLSNRRVLQSAGKLFANIISFTKTSRWTLTERMLLILGLESLVSVSCPVGDSRWDGVTPPDYANDGMARSSLNQNQPKLSDLLQRRRGGLLRAIWQSNDLQNSLKEVTNTIRSIIEAASQSSQDSNGQAMEVDDQDGFGPIRTNASHPATTGVLLDDTGLLHRLYEIYIPLITRGPLLQSSAGQSTRDRVLIERITNASDKNPQWFIMAAPILFREFESGALECNFKQLFELLGAFGELLPLHAYSRNHAVQSATIHLLHATLSLWAAPNTLSDEDTTLCVSQLLGWLCKTVHDESMKAWKTRDAFVQFLEKFVSTDPSELRWQKDKPEFKPMGLLRKCIKDHDIRVRFRTAVALPRVFVTSRTSTQELMYIYNEIKESFSRDLEDYEQMATRFLALANVMVVSSAVRRGPYWHLLETCHHSSNYSRHIEAALNAVVERLGMPSLSSLFEAYAFQLAYSMISNGADFLAFPPRLLGYRDRGSCAEAAFRAFVPTYTIVGALPQYENHCRVLQKNPVDGQREWIGDIVGFFVAGWFDAKPGGSDDEMEKELKEMFLDSSTFNADIASNVDSIVSSIFRTLGDQDYSAEGPINAAILQADPSGKASKIFSLLTRYRQLYPIDTHKPNLPTFGASSVVRALTWLSKRVENAFGKATIYHVMHDLFAGIQKTPLINEKYRLLNSLCMWTALRHEDLVEATLLHTLLHGATSLLGQHNLARSAQSILELTFRTYRKLKVADVRLSRILVRISAICHDYSTRKSSVELSRLGAALSTWVDEQTYFLSQIAVLKSTITKALPAWPREPSKELAELSGDIKLETLSEVLKDEQISSNKFRIVRRLREYLSHEEIDFGSETFWRLKECIPQVLRLQEEDAIAFTGLIIHNHGRINSLTAEQTTSHSVRTRHRRLTKKVSSKEEFITEGRDAIIYGLLTLLEDESPTLVHTAYNALRLMMAVLPSAVAQLQTWSPEYRIEVEYLQSYPRPALKRPYRNLSILLSSEYYVEMSSKFSQWILHLSVLIADIMASRDASFGQLYSILSTDVASAEQDLPVLILCLLQAEQLAKEAKSKTIISDYFTKILTFPGSCLSTVRCIVEVALHLRSFQIKKEDPLAANHWLDLDYLLLAKNAVRCGAYTTALLFLELAAEDGSLSGTDSNIAEQIQYEIYAHIDEPDGFYGIQTQNLHQFLIQRLHHEKQWDKAFRFHGAMLEAHSANPTSDDASGLLQSFHAFGFNQLAIKTLQLSDTWAVSHDTSGTAMSYKLGWRSETWDMPDRDTYSTGAPLYNALRAIYRERDTKMVDLILRHSFYKELDQLKSLGVESIAEIRDVLQSLMCLNQILGWKNAAVQQNQQGKAIDFSKWIDFTSINSEFEFSDLENIMSARIALVRSIRQREERQIGNIVSPFVRDLLELEKLCLLSLSQAAREADQTQIALNSILRARNLGANPSAEISQEYANVLWSMNEPKLAVTYLNEMLKHLQVDSNHLKANLLSKLGTWTSEACLEKPTETWKKYFVPAKSALETTPSQPIIAADVYHQCAEFADKQYHMLSKSSDMIRRKVYIDRKTQEIEERQKQLTQLSGSRGDSQRDRIHDISRAQADAKKLLAADKEQHKKQKAARDEFLKQALDMYSQSLRLSDAFDNDAPIKFSSLWFANFDDEVIKEATIQTALDRVPSRKFIFLAHQLTARMSKTPIPSQERNQDQLQRLVVRFCQEHPFHSLYQVYCLQADAVNIDASRRHSGRHTQSQMTSQTDRSSAAEDVLARLREDASAGPRVQDVEKTCLAYLQWAKYALTKPGQPKLRSGVTQPIPPSMLILSLAKVKVPVLTVDTKIDPSLQYEDCVWIERYQNRFDTAGGVNLPKICVCYGTDGGKYKQLFKGEGKDDMRQDAVMEQVFDLVNKVLSADRETSRRTLQVRSYKVVPLGTQAGVLEFVTNTSPLREWLLRGHALYRPTDIDHKEAGGRISKAHNSSTEERLKVYNSVRSKFKPVFRHFFTEKHKNPMAWFATRLRYTRSVATTSIVGHVLGLGDRHTSNILMDNATGEVVHIDLGIAFDQGKLLPIPELVPFRLTRDIVDGMGVSGTQGVFQRCAEETLRVLREGSDIIMTVLEVFKYDPLHSWTASEVKIRQAQQDVTPINDASRFNFGIGIDMNSGTAEEAADRALTSVARKLDKSLSVESTVNELIAEATDAQNLAVIFHGWGPHL